MFNFAHALLMTSRRNWHLKTFNLKNVQALVFITLFKLSVAFHGILNQILTSWLAPSDYFLRSHLRFLQLPYKMMSPETKWPMYWNHIPTNEPWPIKLPLLENLHSLNFSSHLFPIEIPPKPIKRYITLYSSQPIYFNATSPSFPPKALTLDTTYLHLADGAWNSCLYHFVFVLSS